jgi:hypothetical protein
VTFCTQEYLKELVRSVLATYIKFKMVTKGEEYNKARKSIIVTL